MQIMLMDQILEILTTPDFEALFWCLEKFVFFKKFARYLLESSKNVLPQFL